METVLLIEDDKTIVAGLQAVFSFHGLTLLHAANGAAGLSLAAEAHPDLLIIDIMLPDIDGFDLCRHIRENDAAVPIIFLSAKSQESDKLLGFELGADDYVTKPFSAKELLARVKANLKRVRGVPVPRQPQRQESAVLLGSCRIDLENFMVERGGRTFRLTAKEQKVLRLLVENLNGVVARDTIIDRVWGDEYSPAIKTIDNIIRRLRIKIEDDPRTPRYIVNIHGAGFKLVTAPKKS